jgi:hypothetical protein
MEIINNGQITPQRLHALLKLVGYLGRSTRQEILDYLQPPSLIDNQDAAKSIFNTAIHLDFIIVSEDDERVELNNELKSLEDLNDIEVFRRLMQDNMFGVSDANDDNYLFNQVAAWYVVNDEGILRLGKKEIENKFIDDLYSDSKDLDSEAGRPFNTTKLNAWLNWAAFLGLGWMYKGKLIPDATTRLRPILKRLNGNKYEFSKFIELINKECPELDDGVLFTRCLQSIRSTGYQRGHLSLMFSTALRILHDTKEIMLDLQPDAKERRRLYPAVGHPISEVSRIEIGVST